MGDEAEAVEAAEAAEAARTKKAEEDAASKKVAVGHLHAAADALRALVTEEEPSLNDALDETSPTARKAFLRDLATPAKELMERHSLNEQALSSEAGYAVCGHLKKVRGLNQFTWKLLIEKFGA